MRALLVVGSILVCGGVAWYLLAAGQGSSERLAPSEAAPRADRAVTEGPRERDRELQPRRDGTLEDRVARLEDEVAGLRRQLALRGRVAVSGGGSDPASIVDDPVLDGQVRGIFEEEREREREQEQELRRERFEEMRIAALDELVEVAGLADAQRETVDRLWSTEMERVTPLMDAARSGDRSFTEVREEIRAIRKETDDAAKATLSDDQYAQYEELRPRGPGGRRGEGRRGG